jgi:hypothetical protein
MVKKMRSKLHQNKTWLIVIGATVLIIAALMVFHSQDDKRVHNAAKAYAKADCLSQGVASNVCNTLNVYANTPGTFENKNWLVDVYSPDHKEFSVSMEITVYPWGAIKISNYHTSRWDSKATPWIPRNSS